MKHHINSLIHILLVDDDAVSTFLAKKRLEKNGFKHIDVAKNGLAAATYIKDETPDLLFLDLNMPVMDGLEFLKLTQQQNICHDTPIVILTSSSRVEDKEQGMFCSNVIDYVEKPLNDAKIERVLEKMSNHYGLKKNSVA